jgi:preprotein translocase subunit YajC
MEQMVGNILLFGLLFGFIYFVMIRPNKRARAEHQRLVDSIQPGDDVMTTTGIFGTVRSVGDEELRMEIAPGVEIKMLKRAIATRVSEELEDEEDDTDREIETA